MAEEKGDTCNRLVVELEWRSKARNSEAFQYLYEVIDRGDLRNSSGGLIRLIHLSISFLVEGVPK
jgi:hypothetical protein